jgi:uncharacterized protein YecE (DUF72 family)
MLASARPMRVLVGTSGFSYKEWLGAFYPPKLKPAEMLGYYAARLPCVELNNTFYRMPNPSLIEGWHAKVPDNFRFVLKAPRGITHIRKLANSQETLAHFVALAQKLGAQLGPLLFQLPPQFPRDVPRLAQFVALLPPAIQAAFEFRHPSWFEPAVYDTLRAANAALCASEVDEAPISELVSTARFGYLRLRRSDYSDSEIASWAERIRATGLDEVYVFFKHELRATELAAKLSAHFA